MKTATPMIHIHEEHSGKGLVEAGQQKNVRFAFVYPVKGGYKTIMPFVKCRDYMKDALFCKYVMKRHIGTIYGFDTSKFDYENHVEDSMMFVVQADDYMMDTIESQLEVVRRFEKRFQTSEATITRLDKNNLLVVADSAWQKSLLAVSLYTFLFRWAAWPGLTPDGADKDLATKCEKLYNKIEHISKLNTFGFGEKVSKAVKKHNEASDYGLLSFIHNYNGIYWVEYSAEYADAEDDGFDGFYSSKLMDNLGSLVK